jgi:DNA modification methylase
MKKRTIVNHLNELDSKSWLKFQKSWFIHNPPARRKDVLRHPAKFPETMAQDFIEFFTKKGGVVLDPMAGTGSSMIAALRCGRNGIGIEINPTYANIARQVIQDERNSSDAIMNPIISEVITGDAKDTERLLKMNQIDMVDYVITSPPYWDMLHAKGSFTQKARRETLELDTIYSDNPDDLGNIHDYFEFLDRLANIYKGLKPIIRKKGYLTIIVKNIKKGGKIYPLAWDLAYKLSDTFTLKDEKIWCQDDIRLAPYGYGNAWVSNTFHHYCLQFRNEN